MPSTEPSQCVNKYPGLGIAVTVMHRGLHPCRTIDPEGEVVPPSGGVTEMLIVQSTGGLLVVVVVLSGGGGAVRTGHT